MHKSPSSPLRDVEISKEISSPGPKPGAQKATVVAEDPAIVAERRARTTERCNALFMKLRARWPILFAAKKPVLMAVGNDVIVERLGLDPEGAHDLRVVLGWHTAGYPYQRAFSREGAARLDLDGQPAAR